MLFRSKEWPSLPKQTQELIKRDLEEEFKLDDIQREEGGRDWYALGANCDRREWEKVRALWM